MNETVPDLLFGSGRKTVSVALFFCMRRARSASTISICPSIGFELVASNILKVKRGDEEAEGDEEVGMGGDEEESRGTSFSLGSTISVRTGSSCLAVVSCFDSSID